ncbi:MAG: zinc ribbon domain-containing protein [Chthoniobacterales bacterium]
MGSPKRQKQQTPAVCLVCGEDVPRRALACPECGADHNSGWREDADAYDGVDLPDAFNYEEFTRKEFGSASEKPAGISTFWWITAIALVVLTVLYFVVSQ